MDCMRSRFVAFSVLLAITPLFADVTVRYNTDFKMGPSLPAGVVNQVRNAGFGAFDGPAVIQIKGDKAYTRSGKFAFITDFATNQLTYVDTANMRYATVPAAEFASKLASSMPPLPAAAAGLAGMFKADVQSRKTGRSETIRGVSADEYEVVMTLNASVPNLPASGGPMMRIVMRIWRANASDAAANPAFSEFMRFSNRSESFMNPADFMGKLAGPLQSLGQSVSAIRDELMKQNSPVLRMHMEETSPILAALGQAVPAGFDPAAPLVALDQEVVEFSATPVEDSVFLPPAGFAKVAIEEILKDQFASIAALAR
jgi:hypothetical protein